jgi:hypothetical protein
LGYKISFFLNFKLLNLSKLKEFLTLIIFLNSHILFNIGDWGLGIGDWGLGLGANPPNPIPKTPIPQPPTP